MPTKLTSPPIMSASMPLMLASIGLSATARIALPVRVNDRKQNSAAIADRRDGEVLHLLRSDADRAEAPVALDRQSA